jgi:hypothetical protein
MALREGDVIVDQAVRTLAFGPSGVAAERCPGTFQCLPIGGGEAVLVEVVGLGVAGARRSTRPRGHERAWSDHAGEPVECVRKRRGTRDAHGGDHAFG